MSLPDSGEIVLHRSKSYRDRLRKYNVLVDGEQIGHISAGEVKTFPLPPGDHTVELRIDWKGSPVLNVSITPGEKLHFACGGKGASSALLDLFKKSDAWIPLASATTLSREHHAEGHRTESRLNIYGE